MRTTARFAGIGYLGLAVFGLLGFLVIRPQLHGGDPGLLQALIALELLIVISQAAAAVGFFALFLNDRPVAGFAVAAFGMANAVVILGSAGLLTAALLVSGDESLAAGGDTAATVTLLVKLSSVAWKVGGVFFGLWLIPMGWFALSTRRFPRVLGILLVIGGVGYVIAAILATAVPQAPAIVGDLATLPATAGELWMVGYLLSRGIRPTVV